MTAPEVELDVTALPPSSRIRRALGAMPYGGALPCARMTGMADGHPRRGDALTDTDPEVRAGALERELEELAPILEALADRLRGVAQDNAREAAELRRLNALLDGAAALELEVRRRVSNQAPEAPPRPPIAPLLADLGLDQPTTTT